MKILGVDPGFTATGFAIIEKENNLTRLIDFGCLKLKPTDHLSVRVGVFYTFFQKKILDTAISNISLETSFLGKNPQAFLKLGYLRGILYLLADQHQLPLHENSPTQIKAAVAGTGSASKDQIAFVVRRIFPVLNQATTLRHDVTDAVAIALSGLFAQSRDQQIQKKYAQR